MRYVNTVFLVSLGRESVTLPGVLPFGSALETSGGSVKKYYSFAGQTVAMKDASGFKYFLSDHLGSTSVVLDANGGILEQQRYLPFGGARTVSGSPVIASTDLTYTGQRNLPDTGLMDYRARFYSVSLGRFIQPDTIIPGMANPQSWNRYSYVKNNPVVYNDPTGHWEELGDMGNQRSVNCKKYAQYCNGNKPKSPQELLAMRPPKKVAVPQATSTPILTPTATSTPCPPVLAACHPTATSTPLPTITLTPTLEPYGTPTPFLYDIVNHPQASEIVSQANPWAVGYGPDVSPIWDTFLRVVMPVFGLAPTTINEITAGAIRVVGLAIKIGIDLAIKTAGAVSNGLFNTSMAVSEAIGNGLNYGPVMPIFYLPSDTFRISSPPEYNN